MTYLTDEASVQDSRPVELYDFASQANLLTRYTSYTQDYVYGGVLYRKNTIKRSPLTVVGSQDVPEMTVTLPVTDPVVQSYIGVGVPPQRMTLLIRRVQQLSGEVRQIWSGVISSCIVRGRDATIRVASIMDDAMRLPIPSAVLSRQCNHVLYDAFCTQSRNNNSFGTTITAISADRKSVTVGGVGAFTAVDDFMFGDAVHQYSRERRTIVGQAGLVMTLDVRLQNTVVVGDGITIARGCKHDVATCAAKFNNVDNFGGHPHIVSTTFFFTDVRRSQ